MSQAIAAVKIHKLPLKRVASMYDISATTLRRHVGEKVNHPGSLHFGRPPTLSREVEEGLARHITRMESSGFGLSPNDVREVAYDYCVTQNIPHQFDAVSKMAGYDWLGKFLLRNPSISIRRPEGLSLQRAMGLNRVEIGKYFTLLEQTVTRLNIQEEPHHIYNFD